MKNRNEMIGLSMLNLSINYQHLSAKMNRLLEDKGLNMTQFSILNHFSHQPQKSETISHLTKTMEMNQPAITKAIKTLCKLSAVRKEIDESDARIQHLFVTDGGLRLLAEAQQACFPLLQSSFEGLADHELMLFLNLLIKVKVKVLKKAPD